MQAHLLILSTVVKLYIYEDLGWPPHGQDDPGNSNTNGWPFGVYLLLENLITYPEICTTSRARHARACSCQMTEILPALQNIFFEGDSAIEQTGGWYATTLWPPISARTLARSLA